MSCQDFSDRLQRLLDRRRPPERDQRLIRHANGCQECRRKLIAWQQIAAVVQSDPETVRGGWRWAVPALAAAIVLAVLFNRGLDREPEGADRVASLETVEVDSPQTLDPAGWWRDVQSRDWVAETMPTVQRVSDSVAPLGRSLMQAVTLLTLGGGERAA